MRSFFDLWLAMGRIFIYSLVLKNRKGVRAHMTNKYDFNAYDTAVALILTRYLSSTGEVKKELGRVVGTGTIDGTALADLLDRAAAWAEEGIKPSDDPKTEKLMDAVKTVLDGFSGKRYVQSIDAGFCQFLDDFYNDRIK